MFRRTARFTWRVGFLVVIALIVKKLLDAHREPEPVLVSSRDEDRRATTQEREPELEWVEPVGTVCPESHPIKAKLGSNVFRRPGMNGYDASKPDRCYASEGTAISDGLHEAKR